MGTRSTWHGIIASSSTLQNARLFRMSLIAGFPIGMR